MGGAGRGLVSLEVRTGTPGTNSDALRGIIEIERAARDLVGRYVTGPAAGASGAKRRSASDQKPMATGRMSRLSVER